MKQFDLRGRYCLVTGAASGIGLELARALAGEGAHLVLVDLPGARERLESLAEELRRGRGVEAAVITRDLALDDGPREVYEQARALNVPVDVLVNNAGLMAYGLFHDIPLEKSERLVKVNVTAYLALMRLFLPDMIARGRGRVLNVCSVAAFQATAFHAVYGAAKAFVQSLSEGVREELRGTGVVLSTLNPAYTNTPMLQSEGFPKKLWWYSISGLGSPQEAARAGVKVLKTGKSYYIPGKKHWVVHVLAPRLFPRRIISGLSYYVLRSKKGG
ncbi:MAG: SDR family oxidoreductase [Pseudomonadota bacterium]